MELYLLISLIIGLILLSYFLNKKYAHVFEGIDNSADCELDIGINLDYARKKQLRSYVKIIAEKFDKSFLLQDSANFNSQKKFNPFYLLKNIVHYEEYRLSYIKSLVEFCLKQYQIEYQTIKIGFFEMKDNHAGLIINKNGVWYIKVDRKFIGNDNALISIISHEMAHYTNNKKMIALTNSNLNEELTDVTAIMAGFGKPQLRSKEIYLEKEGKQYLYKLGYLSIMDIEYLIKIKNAISSRSIVKSFLPINISLHNKFVCFGCGVKINSPKKTGKFNIQCPVCNIKQEILLEQ